MQDCLRLKRELIALRNRYGGDTRMIPSRDRWNPAAAIVLPDFSMPEGIEPGELDVRVPIPALYGFSAVPVYILFFRELSREGAPIPFCRPLGKDELAKNRPYLVDFREQSGWPERVYSLCLSPDWSPGRPIAHIDLLTLLARMRDYLREPHAIVRRTLNAWRERLDEAAGPELFLRVAYYERELRLHDRARESIRRGMKLFPYYSEFARLEIPGRFE